MEIERKFIVTDPPKDLDSYPPLRDRAGISVHGTGDPDPQTRP